MIVNPVGISDTGRQRDNNEDAFFVSCGPFYGLPNLFIVADGMGGHNAGEVASGESIRFFKQFCADKPLRQGEILDYLVAGMLYANNGVRNLADENPAFKGMGATFSACVSEGGKLYVAHVGDSRIYALLNGGIRLLTNDHTYVNEMVKLGQITEQEAKNHPKRNVVTRALGIDHKLSVDGHVFEQDDFLKILLCSDGLTNMVTEEEMLNILKTCPGNDEGAKKLVDLANSNGGLDNITIVLFDVGRRIE